MNMKQIIEPVIHVASATAEALGFKSKQRQTNNRVFPNANAYRAYAEQFKKPETEGIEIEMEVVAWESDEAEFTEAMTEYQVEYLTRNNSYA